MINNKIKSALLIIICTFCFGQKLIAQKPTKPNVIAYYTGNGTVIDSFPIEKISHLIYSFAHLKGDSINIHSAKDSALITRMVGLKKRNPDLKVMIALGGWGGCEPCSEVFSRADGRKTFAKTTKSVLDFFKADGIDLDWEYPAVVGHPGHQYQEADKQNFTELVRELRKTLGKKS